MEVSDLCDHRNLIANSVYPLNSRIVGVPLNDKEHCSWLEFEAAEKWRRKFFHFREECIEVDHVIVRLVCHFAIAAFNELCRMYVKKDEEENIYGAEAIKAKFFPCTYGYIFYLTLEAFEENVSGVYEATVFCHGDGGSRTLIKFIRTTHVPVGMKVKWITQVINEKCMYQSWKEKKGLIKDRLMIMRGNAKKGNKSRVSAEFIRLRNDYEALKALCRGFKQHARLVPSIVCKIKCSNPDDWFIPNKICGLQARCADDSLKGYDYYNPLTVFSGCFERKLCSGEPFERDWST